MHGINNRFIINQYFDYSQKKFKVKVSQGNKF